MSRDLPKANRFPRFTLRWLLLAAIPLAIVLAVYGHIERQRARAAKAYQAICAKGVDAHFHHGTDHIIYFKNGNVTDDDLESFIPAFSDYARSTGIGKITGFRLYGSDVSAEALQRFRQAVPNCEIDP